MNSAPVPKKQPVPFGKYLLLDRINIGGMAEVWRGKRFGLGGFEQLVAIKRILPNIAEDAEFIGMFIEEAKVTAQLAHANIARVYDLGNLNQQSYYIAMEYIPGRDVRAIFDRGRKRGEPISPALACYMIARTCEGLEYAHRKKDGQGREMNIVHRDVSPQNILISYEGEVKLIDFGIAKVANRASQTQAGILKGKFGYMSPEQVAGHAIDRRSDIFAAGICLYELLTNERLFVGESDFAVLEKVRSAEIPPPSSLNPLVPPELDKIVLKALARKVESRYEYASELAEALQDCLSLFPVRANRKELAQFMSAAFADELEREKARLEEYADIKIPESMQGALESETGIRSADESQPIPETETHFPLEAVKKQGSVLDSAEPPSGVPTAPGDRPLSDDGPTLSLAAPELSLTATAAPALGGEEATRSEVGIASTDSAVDATPEPVPTVALRPEGARAQHKPLEPTSGPVRLTPAVQGRPAAEESRASGKWLPRQGSPQMRLLKALAGLVVLLLMVTGYLLIRKPATGYVYLELPPAARGVARVNVNGEDLGERKDWPLVHRTQAGDSLVVVVAKGFKPFRANVKVREGPATTQVAVVLEREVGMQRVLVLTQPEEAQVRINNEWAKEEAVPGPAIVDYPVGTQMNIEASAPGYRVARDQVTVRAAGPTQVVNLRLEPDLIELQVTSDPSGATVIIDGREMGTTPATLHVRGPETTLLLRKRCFVPVKLPVKVDGANAQIASATLRRLNNCR